MSKPRELKVILDELMELIPLTQGRLTAITLVSEIVDGYYIKTKEAVNESTK